jgi:hypothetical protein
MMNILPIVTAISLVLALPASAGAAERAAAAKSAPTSQITSLKSRDDNSARLKDEHETEMDVHVGV